MADHDNHMDQDQDQALEEEAQVMLGFAEPVDLEEHGPLLAEDFCSKMGGLPVSQLFLLFIYFFLDKLVARREFKRQRNLGARGKISNQEDMHIDCSISTSIGDRARRFG
jgi:hypothetical protein